jgi:transposase-like protein
MDAKIVGFWIIWHCPECNRPNVSYKWVNDKGEVLLKQKQRVECDRCTEASELTIETSAGSEIIWKEGLM